MILLALTCWRGYSQTFPFQHYSVEDDLASSIINCIFQDSRGYLWLGTENGISRFDGLRFTTIGIKNDLPDDFILNIGEDRHGLIWVATGKGGVCSLTPGGKLVKAYSIQDGLPSNSVMSIWATQDDIIWFGTSKGLAAFDGKTFRVYTLAEGLCGEYITDIVPARDGGLWLGTDKGLCRMKDGRFKCFTVQDGLIQDNIQKLAADEQGRLWIGTVSGVSVLEGGAFTNYTTRNGLIHNTITSIAGDESGGVWLGGEGGLSLFKNGVFQNFTMQNGLKNKTIFSLLKDREGILWLGARAGLSRLNSHKFAQYSAREGMKDSYVWDILQDRRGNLWLATDSGLTRFDQKKFTSFTTQDGLINNMAYTLMEDRDGQIWIGTDNGVSVFYNNTFHNFKSNQDINGAIVFSLLQKRNGEIWIGSISGLFRFSANRFHADPFREYHSVIAMLEDRRGKIWLATTNGLFILDGESRQHIDRENGLPDKEVYNLFEDSKGDVWVGTKRGLARFQDSRMTVYTAGDGLCGNHCSFVLEDQRGMLWIGSNQGLTRFDGNRFKTYTAEDGLISNELSNGACLKDRDGYLWFGAPQGLTRLDPRLDRDVKQAPPIYITGLNVLGVEYPITPGYRFHYSQNYIKFDFTGIFFTSPDTLRYKYRLRPVDEFWLETSNRSISYAFLPPGEYSFQVIARSREGMDSRETAELRFIILPPIWRTWWFTILAALALLLGAILSYRWRSRRIREQAEFEARTRQLVMAQRMELLGILAAGAVHDLKNLLGIIIGYSQIASSQNSGDFNKNNKNAPIEKIKHTANTAVQLVKQILALARQNPGERIQSDLAQLLDEILCVLKITVPPGIAVIWTPPEQEITYFINKARFQQMIMNLFINAVQAIPGEGAIRIALATGLNHQKKPAVFIEIADSGVGMDEKTRLKIFSPLYTTKEPEHGTGLGLFVVKQIVTELEGDIAIASEPGKGATFTVWLPIQPPSPETFP